MISVNGVELGGSSGSVTAADITDSTSVGRSVLTAADAAAARTAIVAATRPSVLTALGSCVARYLFTETTGTSCADSVGSYTLTCPGGFLAARGGAISPWGRSGMDTLPGVTGADLVVGQCAYTLTPPTLGDAYTLLCWVCLGREVPSAAPYDRLLFNFRESAVTWAAGAYNVAGLAILPGEIAYATIETTAGAVTLAATGARLSLGQWHLVAVRRTRGATMDIVIDGVQVATVAAANAAVSTATGPLTIGGNLALGAVAVNQSPLAIHRDHQIHNAALSDAQLLAMYRESLGLP